MDMLQLLQHPEHKHLRPRYRKRPTACRACTELVVLQSSSRPHDSHTARRYMSTAQDRSRKSWEPQHEYQTSFGERNLMAQQQGHAQQGQQLSQVQQLQQLQGTEQRHMQEHAGQPQPSHQDADAHKEGEESGAGGVHAAGGRPKLRSKTETEVRC